ncbi:MAG: hypothetical protein WA655_21745 [Candidatus Korobacteraceae bacterium]
MRVLTAKRNRVVFAAAAAVLGMLLIASPYTCVSQQPDASQQAGAAKRTRAVGVIKSINGNTITLTTDTGSEINIVIQSATRLARLAPGQSDLKSATPIQLSDVQVGDRMLAGGVASDDGKSVVASTAILMKKSDVAEKQEHDRQEWRTHGVAGVVKSVDPATSTITLSTGTLGAPSTLAVHTSKDTIIRRYAPDSVKFDDAKAGTLDQIKPGDQLRARGVKSDDGKDLAAAEIVSGTFRSIAGAVVSTDAANHVITVTDLANKRPVTLKIGPDSQMHQLPAMFAQRIAMRLKGGEMPASGGAAPAAAASAGDHPQRAQGQDAPRGGFGGGQHAGGPPDFQQMLNRMPAVTLSQLQKGDALMIVATEGTTDSPSTVIILLSGVETILAAASPNQASTILSPWNLATSANAGTGDTP